MIFDEISELQDLVSVLKNLELAKMELRVNVKEVKIVHPQFISVGNVTHYFEITLKSDDIENLIGNINRTEVKNRK